MHDPKQLHRFIDRAEEIFLRPGRRYAWEAIVRGAPVARADGSTRRLSAVEHNTFRGFHRIDKTLPGAGEAFRYHLTIHRDRLLDGLRAVGSVEALDAFEDALGGEIVERLSNIRPDMLGSYNKIRKVLDLYTENLATMAVELEDRRATLVPLLRLPLDSQMFGQEMLFSDQELRRCGLRRDSGYGRLGSRRDYLSLQAIVARQARSLAVQSGRPFHPIYFDLLWRDRYRNWGSNLFETVP